MIFLFVLTCFNSFKNLCIRAVDRIVIYFFRGVKFFEKLCLLIWNYFFLQATAYQTSSMARS